MAHHANAHNLPPLPDFILEKIGGEELVQVAHKFGQRGPEKWAKKSGAVSRVEDDGTTNPSQTYLTADLKKQILAGNYQALADARNAVNLDLQPNLTTVTNSPDNTQGFVEVVNTSNGQKYNIIASNSGWIWSYTTQISSGLTSSSGTPQTQCVVQTGTYSATGKILGVSYQTLTNVPTDITAIAASTMISLVVGGFIKNLILGAIYQAALDAAVSSAAAEAVAGGFMVSEAAASIGATILAGLGAGVVGVIVAIVVFYLADFLHRSYGLTISIYNWDTTSAWDIASWYGDNAVVAQGDSGSGPWKSANLLPVQNSVPGPFGPIPSTNPVAQYATYAYQNDNEWLEGLGVAMQMTSANAAFNFKYIVQRFANNLIGVSSNTAKSIGDFYNDSSSWQPSGAYSYTGPIDGRPDLSVTIITTSLNSDRGYSFDVHIGLAQSK